MERAIMRVAQGALAFAFAAALGCGLGGWAVNDTNAFYTYPSARTLTPAYARERPVADTFWNEQSDMPLPFAQAETGSTATSAQPAYLSASGS